MRNQHPKIPFLSFSSPSSSRSASPVEHDHLPPQIYTRLEQMEKSISEVQRAQERAMAIFEGYKEEHRGIGERLEMITEFFGMQPMLLREKLARERLAAPAEDHDTGVPIHVPTEAIPAFSIGPPEADSEDSSSGVDSDVPGLEHSDAEESTEVPRCKPARTQTTASDLTITRNDNKKGEEGPDLRDQRPEEGTALELSSKAPPIPEKSPRRGRSAMRKPPAAASSQVSSPPQSPKPHKHISFTNLLLLQHKKSASASNLTTAQHGKNSSSNLSSPEKSPNLGSTDLKATGAGAPVGGKRSHSAINLKGLTEGMSHFSLGETDPKRMRTVDATLANEMVFGGLKKGRGRSGERSS